MREVVTLVDALEATASRMPEGLAFRFRDEEMSFGELADRSARLAGTLIDQGVAPGGHVGVFTGKCLESLVAVYGIMQAGAAWVPLDPMLPPERLAFMLDDGDIRHLVTTGQQAARVGTLPEASRRNCSLYGATEPDGFQATYDWAEILATTARRPAHRPGPDDAAYIMYTSGSTGQPKGIVHTHRSGLAYACAAADTFEVSERDRLSGFPPLHFDQSTFHLFAGVLRGAAAVLVPDEFGGFPVDLARLIESESMTIWYSVPYVLIQMATRGALEERDFAALRWVKFGGEPFPPKYLRRLMANMPRSRFANIYGPAEVNHCTHYVLPGPPDKEASIPIGKAWDIAELLLLDADDQQVGPGHPGELLVHTDTMLRGYWGRPDLDAHAFYTLPEAPDRRWYRTGDLVREREDGELEFLGRLDRQVKTRGYRVELDEVEAALLAHADIQETAVYLVEDADGTRLLEAGIIPRDAAQPSVPELVMHLQPRLARYAIPASFRFYDVFPRTASGKIDRKELAARRSPAGNATN